MKNKCWHSKFFLTETPKPAQFQIGQVKTKDFGFNFKVSGETSNHVLIHHVPATTSKTIVLNGRPYPFNS